MNLTFDRTDLAARTETAIARSPFLSSNPAFAAPFAEMIQTLADIFESPACVSIDDIFPGMEDDRDENAEPERGTLFDVCDDRDDAGDYEACFCDD